MKKKDWLWRLERAERRGRFTAEDFALADKWVACPIGEKLRGDLEQAARAIYERIQVEAKVRANR